MSEINIIEIGLIVLAIVSFIQEIRFFRLRKGFSQVEKAIVCLLNEDMGRMLDKFKGELTKRNGKNKKRGVR